MVVPHVAIIANTALTTSDLTSLKLVAPENTPEPRKRNTQPLVKGGMWEQTLTHFGVRSGNAHTSTYKAAWQWDQGRCKQGWLEKYSQEYPGLGCDLHKDLGVSYLELAGCVWLPGLVMLLAPCSLACLIRYVRIVVKSKVVQPVT